MNKFLVSMLIDLDTIKTGIEQLDSRSIGKPRTRCENKVLSVHRSAAMVLAGNNAVRDPFSK